MTLPRCKYWDKCYRKNPEHLKQFSHPPRKEDKRDEVRDFPKGPTMTKEQQNTEKATASASLLAGAMIDASPGKDEHAAGSKRKASIEESGEEIKRLKMKDNCQEKQKTRADSVDKKLALEDEKDSEDEDDYLVLVSPTKLEEKTSDGDGVRDDARIESPIETGDFLKAKYSMEFPKDLYDFWEFCCSTSPLSPVNALNDAGLLLVGPFDVLAVKRSKKSIPPDADLTLHWRFFLDPPEMTTILAATPKTADEFEELEGLHFGYFRDDPSEMPAFVAASCKSKGCVMSRAGSNVFSAVAAHCHRIFKLERRAAKKQKIKALAKAVEDRARVKGHEVDSSMKTEAEKQREKKVVAKPLHGLGMVVPYDKKTQVGYRELPETNTNLKKLFAKWTSATAGSVEETQNFAPIQEILTFVQFANDECDYGMGLEFALDAFSFGHEKFHDVLVNTLPLAYKLLGRDHFAVVAESHLKNRTDTAMPKQF